MVAQAIDAPPLPLYEPDARITATARISPDGEQHSSRHGPLWERSFNSRAIAPIVTKRAILRVTRNGTPSPGGIAWLGLSEFLRYPGCRKEEHMHRVTLRLGATLIAAAALAFPASALAAEADSTGTITGGSLSLTTTATPTFSAILDGTDKVPTYNLPITIEDSTGTGAGWNTTVTSTEFSTGGTTPQTLSTTASWMSGVTSACAETTCTNPTNSVTYPLLIPAAAIAPTAVKFFNAAADTGLGKFTVTPTVGVSVPANTYAGTYTSTVTLASVSGP